MVLTPCPRDITVSRRCQNPAGAQLDEEVAQLDEEVYD